MDLVPSHIWESPTAGGDVAELRIFNLLQKIRLSDSCVAMHSQNIVGGISQTWSEMDFLIISERAIIGIEVKAGRVATKNGKWHVYNANGGIKYTKRKSPLVQISNALDHFRTSWFTQRFSYKYKRLPFVKVAILCNNERPDAQMGPELQDELMVYKEDLYTPDTLKHRLNIAINYSIENIYLNSVMSLNKIDVRDIKESIRPQLDLSYPSRAKNSAIEKEQNELTEQQYKTADLLNNFNRYILDGGAGTGKTFLLIYDAMRKFKQGHSVGILAPTPQLAAHISHSLDKQIPCFDRSSANEYGPFDILYVDEAQDFFNQTDFEILDNLIQGGVAEGIWRFYGDLQNQISFGKVIDKDVFNFLLDCTGNNAVCSLTRNVRNTPEIVNYLEKICLVRIGETSVMGAGPDVHGVDYDKGLRLITGLDEHSMYGLIRPEELVILYPECLDDLSKKKLISTYKNRFRIFSVAEFRGLESSVVFLIGLDLNLNDCDIRDAVYCGVSRARGLCLIGGGKSALRNIHKMRANYEE